VVINVKGVIAMFGARQDLVWTVHSSGAIEVESRYFPSTGTPLEMPRFGMQTTLRPGFNRL